MLKIIYVYVYIYNVNFCGENAGRPGKKIFPDKENRKKSFDFHLFSSLSLGFYSRL